MVLSMTPHVAYGLVNDQQGELNNLHIYMSVANPGGGPGGLGPPPRNA